MPRSGDLDPSFTFDVGAAKPQSPWEFKSALKDARPTSGTSLQEKIAARLAERKEKGAGRGGAGAGGGAGGRGRGGQAAPSSDDDDDDDDDASGDDDSDAPLPGEADDDDTASGSEEEEEEEEDEEEEEEVSDGSEPAASSSDDDAGEVEGEEGEDDALPAAADSGDDEGGEGAVPAPALSSSDDDDADPQAAAAAAAKRRRAAAAATADGARHSAAAARGAEGGRVFDAAPAGTAFTASSFASLRLSKPLVKACAALGYARPTPIQAACIPLALLGRDIAGSAITGSGKTAAFTLPLLERLLHRPRSLAATYGLILTPARELAVQVAGMAGKLAQFTDVRVALVVGGLSLASQAAALRARPEIVVGTPGRLVDHLRNSPSFTLDDVQTLVLDEADRLLDMGFSAEVAQIVRATPRGRQTLLFSATLSRGDVAGLATLALRKPVRLAADAAWAAPAGLVHEVVRLKGAGGAADREAVLLALAARTLGGGKKGGGGGGGGGGAGGGGGGAIIFFRTKQAAHRAAMLFGLAGLPPAAELHGNMTQAARLDALERFRTGAASALLATDVAARGLDVLGVRLVINADAPPSVATYLHRAGRTARAGASGRVVTLVTDADRKLMKAVARGGGGGGGGGGPSGGAPAPRLTARTIPPPALAAWRERLEGLEGDVRRLVREEAEETALRKAEMEAAKAEHLVDHADEIAARPPRTWFQTGAEKRKVAAAAKAAAEAEAAEPGNARARKEAKRAELKRERAAAAAAEARAAKRARLVTETAALSRSIRAVKSKAVALKRTGVMTSGKAAKAAAAAVTGLAQATSKARKKAAAKLKARRAARGGGGGGGLEGGGDELGGGGGGGAPSSPAPAAARPPPSRVYAGGPKSGALRVAGGRSRGEAKAAKRGGKGAHAFKSKAKHKRRK